jgi:predicted secreted protein
MNWVTGIAVYFVLWWLVLFTVLPFGIRPAEEGDIGAASGAPANPRLGLRLLVTTAITTVLWLVFLYVVNTGLISFRE